MRRRPLLPKRVSSPVVPPWGLLRGGLYNLHALPRWVSCLLHDERVEAHFRAHIWSNVDMPANRRSFV